MGKNIPVWVPADIAKTYTDEQKPKEIPEPFKRNIEFCRSLPRTDEERRKENSAHAAIKDTQKLLDILTTDREDVRNFWNRLSKIDGFTFGSAEEHGLSYEYYYELVKILLEWGSYDLFPESMRDKELARITKLASDLSEAIASSTFFKKDETQGFSYLNFGFPDDFFMRDIFKFQCISKPRNGTEKTSTENKAINESEFNSALYNAMKRSISYRIGEENDLSKISAIETELLTTAYAQTVSNFLETIAEIATHKMTIKPIISKPLAKGAKKQFIAKRLYQLHMQYFNQPCWELLSLAATFMLDSQDALTPDDLRPYCK